MYIGAPPWCWIFQTPLLLPQARLVFSSSFIKTHNRRCRAPLDDVQEQSSFAHGVAYTIKDTAGQQSTEAIGLQTGEDSNAQEQETVPETAKDKESQRHQAVQRS